MPPGATSRCPTCGATTPASREERPRDFPFCSERCRLVDLHKWFSGHYFVPGPAAAVPEAPADGPEEPR